MVKVAVNIVTFNSASHIEACLEGLERQTFRNFRTQVLDNASADGTRRILRNRKVEFIESPTNTGFARAHNDLIRGLPAEYVLILNPDAVLKPDFLEKIIAALDARPDAASASGKLLRFDGMTIDSTGIVMIRGQRHLDRGAGEPDLGQYDRPEEIFGPSGAAAVYRMSALNDVAFEEQFFDEDFFAYREDADLAWRCRARGWKSIYVPAAVALHRRMVTPERRSSLPAAINYHSVKNRFLLRLNNMTARQYRKDFWRITARDVLVVGYVFLREWSSLPAFVYLFSNFRRLWKKRRIIQSMSRTPDAELDSWLYNNVR